MKFLVPIIALGGLLVVMSVPAPGIVGVSIGGTCVVVILGWGIVLALNACADKIVSVWGRRKTRRAVHAHSGIARKI